MVLVLNSLRNIICWCIEKGNVIHASSLNIKPSSRILQKNPNSDLSSALLRGKIKVHIVEHKCPGICSGGYPF